MNPLFIVLLVIVAIIALPLILALFTKKSYTVHREVVVNKPTSEVFDYIKHIENQKYFSKWVMADPNAKMTTTGTDGAVGFTSAWDSENKQVGKGEQEIKKINPGTRMDVEVRFERPFKAVSQAYYTTESQTDGHTKLVWGFIGNMKYPMNAMMFFMDFPKILGKDMQESLGNLKVIMEK